MAGASVETTLELWASSLRDVKARIRPLFSQERVAVSAGKFLDGLLGNEPRKTGWMRAEAAGDSGPWRQQAIRIVRLIGDDDGATGESSQERFGAGQVMRLSRRNQELERSALAVDPRVDFRGEPAAAAPHTAISTLF